MASLPRPSFDSGWQELRGTRCNTVEMKFRHGLTLTANNPGDDVKMMTVLLSNDGGRTLWHSGACTSSGDGQYGSTVTVDSSHVRVLSNAIGGPAYNMALGGVATHIRIKIWT
eukprot:gnl/Spiro4/11608_TR6132_c0_g2_i1.p1 gnl/Spiro4/11608_TR6132_c0_g2~~gnl/Spiro4/11608_TR6132_c0_g2_i1.p1  ORF type:complete len:122 (-),score=14.02 gnl/Spiro4/11608_TR6132_c0_g2_i1:85-423(-)